ncbi:MAG: transcription antitermination factor NusB [Acidobacteriota bacterium]|nr:transcription antitermination factor NusB [Blastocatellia bacterium]MDW8240122.1 transcription antitermination factor NusB [Acidobacteriota bacterium]
MGSRRKARESAMQLLYQYDFAKQPMEELFKSYWQNLREDVDEDVRQYATRLAVGTLEHLDEVDEQISRHAHHWRLPRMASVDRSILRVAVYEMLYEPETPRVVVIDEAIEIARRYSTYEATQFINGLLDAIRRHLESDTPLRAQWTRKDG